MLGFLDLVEEDAVDGHGHVVLRDDLLLVDVDRPDTHVDQSNLVEQRNDEVNPRPADAEKPPQPEDHATLPLRRDPDGGGDGAVDDQARKACEDRQTGSRLEQRRAEHRVMTSPTTKTMPDT